MKQFSTISRRSFLKALVGLCLFTTLVTGLGYRYRRSLYRKFLKLRLDESAGTGVLGEGDFQVIHAAFEVISPRPAPSVRELLEFVNWRTSTVPGYYREYRDAANLLQSTARRNFGRDFLLLDEHLKNKLLQGVIPLRTFLPIQEALPIQKAEPSGFLDKVQLALETLIFRAEARFKYFIFWDLLMFYWRSRQAWESLGYSSYPGVPDLPRAYEYAPAVLHKNLFQ